MNKHLNNGFTGLRGLLAEARTGQGRNSRVALVVLACLALAGVSVLIGLFLGLIDNATGTQEWLLPMFLAVFFVIMAPVVPAMPIWEVSVPDNEVWMITDRTDHLEKFVPSGVYRVRPLQGFAPYPDKGPISILVDLEKVVTSDHFPYHVTVKVSGTFNPMDAEEGKWKFLRMMTKDKIEKAIANDLTDIVKRNMLQIGRSEIDPPALIQTISDATREAVAARASMGVRLGAINPVKVSMEPPPEVLDSRNALWQEESKAEARVKHLVEMLKVSGAHNVSVGDLGRLNFVLNPQPGMRLSISGSHDFFPAHVAGQKALPSPKADNRPPIQMPKLEAPTPVESLPAQPVKEDLMTPPTPPPEPPMHLPEDIPPRPEPARKKGDPDVIETVQDENGTYVPRNPILGRRKSKTGNLSRPNPNQPDDPNAKRNR